MKKCLLAGTFDPVTRGHELLLEECLKLFDCVHLCILKNPTKIPYFHHSERLKMLEIVAAKYKNVIVDSYDGLLVEYLKKNGIEYNIRGVRNNDDFSYEMEMATMNEQMYPEITTLFIPTPHEYINISSSAAKQAIKSGESTEAYLSPEVAAYVKTLIKK